MISLQGKEVKPERIRVKKVPHTLIMFPFRIRINPNLSRSLATMLEGIQKYLILGSGTSNTKAGASHNSKQLLIML